MSRKKEEKINMSVFVALCKSLKNKDLKPKRDNILEDTGKSYGAWWLWTQGERIPCKKDRQSIATFFNTDVEVLFPGHSNS